MNDEDAWIGRATALLDRSVEGLDAHTLSRLNRARQAALAQAHPQRRHARVVGGTLLLGSLAVLMAIGVARRHGPAVSSTADDATAEVLADEDNLDLYDDLDFYAWLDAQQGGGHG
jgi:uncharacterized protein DUF3619